MAKDVNDFWIYQARQTDDMWTLHVIVETDRARAVSRTFDVCMYAEFIPRSTKSDTSIRHALYRDPGEFADDIARLCFKYGKEFEDSDKEQLIREFIDILMYS